MAAPLLAQWKALLDTLYGPGAPKAPLSQKTLRAYGREAGFPEALEAFHPAGRVHCGRLLSLCRPLLDRLSPEPPGGWLPFFYEALSHGLYPDPGRPADTRGQRQALWLFTALLEQQLAAEARRCPRDPLSDVPALTPEELAASRLADEYGRFQEAIRTDHFLALLRLGRDIMPFDPASHTIGVHHVALSAARQAAQAGLPVDVALVSAAALSHDIGKFGCRGPDARRIPYLHYYYTW